MPNLEIVLQARDETGKAFASAQGRAAQMNAGLSRMAGGRGYAGLSRDMDRIRVSTEGVNTVMHGLTGALAGNLSAVDQLGWGMMRLSGGMGAAAKAGLVLGAAFAGVELGRALDKTFALSNKIAGLVTGVSEFDVVTRERLDYAAKRVADEAAANRKAADAIGAAVADVKRETGALAGDAFAGVTATFSEGKGRLDRELQEAQEKLKTATQLRDKEARKSEWAPGQADRIEKAQRAVDEAQADLKRAMAIAAAQSEALQARLKRALAEAIVASEKEQIARALAGFELAADKLKDSIAAINDEFAALGDSATAGLARAAMAAKGATRETAALKEKQVEIAAKDQLIAAQKQARDPDWRRAQRDLQRERRQMDEQIAHVRERAERNRPLARWEKELLVKAEARDRKIDAGQNLLIEEANIKDQRRTQAERNLQSIQEHIERLTPVLEKLLTAAGA
jgi:chromosome segregation ATPase